ncbi:ABC transporter ATP-binding protein [Halobacteria archaeon AArc-m2/3/4]|uniref:ABC transporter ATP-binding protein n=1 Tax=Natronoglomus mannanivorans TaxID=2979990 RepID=A0ABT2QKN6_9EURY|nr:ABC transporter ATP-binding protein [Halobacteria archaeon AArc-m2/3/4]
MSGTTEENVDSESPRSVRSEGNTILEVRDATVSFEMERGESRVLNGVDLSVERDEVLGIVGESGSGKSMLANALLDAVVDPGKTSGSVRYFPPDGRDPIDVLELNDDELRTFRWEEISIVFQGAMSSFNPTMKIRDHFAETIDAHDADPEECIERAYDLLSELYLDADRVLDSYPHELSGGMQQRTLIALSLILEPDVLVMDEPTAALDLLMQRSIISLLDRLQREYDLTLVFITHDLPLVAHLADRIAVMYAFELAEIGPAEEIITNAAHPYTRMLLGSTPNLDAPVDEMRVIEGSSPDPVAPPTGCRYHPRCPISRDICAESSPEFEDVSAEHQAACFFHEEASDAVTYPIGEDNDAIETEGSSTSSRDYGEPILSLDDVTVEFEGDQSILDLFDEPEYVRAVDDVSLDVHEDDVVALVGESGCGKTTLGKTIIGVHRPESGNVTYRGQDIWEARDSHREAEISFSEIRGALQMIHQDPGSSLNPNKRVIHSLRKPLKKSQPDLERVEQERRIMAMLEYVGMSPPEDYANRYPHQLSGGEKQRVALIRALLMNPDVILADEAISALDVSLRVEMMELLLDLQGRFNTSFVFISHDLSNARYLAEKADGRIAVMYLGEIVEIGTVEQIIHDPQHPYTQALRWATPDLNPRNESEESPIRAIDIPDPKDPPSGCRFHTRCPEAREICRQVHPTNISTNGSEVACFRADPDHDYWDSPSIVNEESDDDETSMSTLD